MGKQNKTKQAALQSWVSGLITESGQMAVFVGETSCLPNDSHLLSLSTHLVLVSSFCWYLCHLDHLIGIGACNGHCNLTIPSVNCINLPLVLKASLVHYYSRHQHHPGHWRAYICTCSLKISPGCRGGSTEHLMHPSDQEVVSPIPHQPRN